MLTLKCKMCGGDIQADESQTYGTCDSCGNAVTLPRIHSEQQANLFNRANHFRQSNQFDKAIAAFEKILEEDDQNAEAHWGILLSRYGIEYVEDPKSHERIPTCHRVQPTSFLADADYQSALSCAPDGYSRSLYEEEGQRIAQMQKGILAISQRESPYDVFLCYRETSEAGTRTKESVLTQELYYELTEAGHRVFFSRITLESKLGAEYEPYIFAALNSARVMLVVGTSTENFNSVWVKNEWSRYLEQLKERRDRTIIPCYRDMDPYDLPEELSVYQSQDMAKLGFMQDLLRGVEKILGAEQGQTDPRQEGTTSADQLIPGVESLCERAELFLEDQKFDKADEYFERVLDLEPKYARAYIGKLCVERECKNEADLVSCESSMVSSENFQKVMRFGDVEQRTRLSGYETAICAYLEKERQQEEEQNREQEEQQRKQEEQKRVQEETDLQKIYPQLVQKKEEVNALAEDTVEQLDAKIMELNLVKILLESQHGYQNSTQLAQCCEQQIQTLKEKLQKIEMEEGNIVALWGLFLGISLVITIIIATFVFS